MSETIIERRSCHQMLVQTSDHEFQIRRVLDPGVVTATTKVSLYQRLGAPSAQGNTRTRACDVHLEYLRKIETLFAFDITYSPIKPLLRISC